MPQNSRKFNPRSRSTTRTPPPANDQNPVMRAVHPGTRYLTIRTVESRGFLRTLEADVVNRFEARKTVLVERNAFRLQRGQWLGAMLATSQPTAV